MQFSKLKPKICFFYSNRILIPLINLVITLKALLHSRAVTRVVSDRIVSRLAVYVT